MQNWLDANIPAWLQVWLKGAAMAFAGGAVNVLTQATQGPAPFSSWRKVFADAASGGMIALIGYFRPSPAQTKPTNTEKET